MYGDPLGGAPESIKQNWRIEEAIKRAELLLKIHEAEARLAILRGVGVDGGQSSPGVEAAAYILDYLKAIQKLMTAVVTAAGEIPLSELEGRGE